MAPLTLVIANRNYSSWSLRPWLLMKHLGLAFDTIVIQLDTATTHDKIERYSPSGLLPVLLAGTLCVWDSLAICEYLAEITAKGWPRAPEARAQARSLCAEIHSGFQAVRTAWPMNARARNRRTAMTPALAADVERINEIWNDCRHRHGGGGPWLFGDYSIADAMYAPVVLRFNTYGASISEAARAYMAGVLEDAALQEWVRAAQQETWTIPSEEVG
jgi:glutathione S-transferase